MAQETYVIDSKGTTLYRNGVKVCRFSCDPPARTTRSAPPPTFPAAAPGPRKRTIGTDRYPIRPSGPVAAPVATPRYPVQRAAVPARPPPRSVAQSKGPPVASPPTDTAPEKSEGLTKEQKALILNAGGALAITAYGVAFWDYFRTAPKADNEGWFGRTTRYGGADKLGHFWSSYAVGHLFSFVYQWWDFDRDEANSLGALSSLGMQTLMEVGDAFSGDSGFSYEDALMNVAGAGAAYLFGRYPDLARKIDFRFEYRPESFSDLTDDPLTDYDHLRYLVALKLDGFDMLHDSYLSYLELQAGYYTRGYEDWDPGGPDDRRRNLYFGVGFNVSKLVQNFVDTRVFDYIQVPYTTVGVSKGLD